MKVLAPEWSCSGSSKAVWDLILRLDYGPSPLDGRLELKTSFLGKTKQSCEFSDFGSSFNIAESTVTKQVYHDNIVKKVPVGTCQVSCTIGMIEVLMSDNHFSSEEHKAKTKSEDMSAYLERIQCECTAEQIDTQLVHKKMYGCYLRDDQLFSLCLLS